MFPFCAFLIPTRPNLVIAAAKLAWKVLLLLAKEFTVALDLESVKRTWSEEKRPFPC